MMFPDNEVTRNLKEVAQTLTAVKNTQGEIDKTVTEIRLVTKKKNPDITASGFFRHLSTANYSEFCRNFCGVIKK